MSVQYGYIKNKDTKICMTELKLTKSVQAITESILFQMNKQEYKIIILII